MSRNLARLRLGILSTSVAAALVVVSVVGFVLTLHSADQQEAALQQSETNQAATYASSALSALLSSIDSDAAVVKATGGSSSVFDRTAKASSSSLPAALVKKAGRDYVVVAATGAGLRPGEVLTGPALATVEHAGDELTAGPAYFDGKLATVRFAIGAPTTPAGFVVYEQATFDPLEVMPFIAGHAFDELQAVLYAGSRVDQHDLVIAYPRATQLTGSVARADVAVGSSNWLLTATARRTLIGGVAAATPYIILVLGLLMAFVAWIALEILQRRHRYANSLVSQRTAELNRSLDDLRDAQVALVRGERLAAVGEMATIVGHELRNPLAAVINALYLIRSGLREPISDVVARNLSMAETEAHKAAALADDLTAFVRPRELERTRVEATGMIDEVLAASPPPPGTELVVDVEPFTLEADRGQLAEIITNLVTNAYQAIVPGGTVRISLRAEGPAAQLVVEDDGSGIEESVADSIFDPFVTTKYRGTGLGLAIVQRLVGAHGGTVRAENVSSGGARFTVVLPLELEVVAV